MKILDIYEERKVNELREERDKKVGERMNSDKYISRYNEIVKTCEASLEEFANEEDVKANDVLFKTGYFTTYDCEINHNYKLKLVKDINEEFEKRCEELTEYLDEVKSIIELIPQDGNYDTKVVEVLKNYNILDKKGKINA